MAIKNKTLDFLIIGSGKSGTTSLADYVAQHPDITITNPKEPWFFDTKQYENGMAWYWNKYLAHYSGENFVGEASSQTLFVPYTPERLHATIPDAKLIAILRNPVERAYSDWWMKYCYNLEKDDFETAIEKNFRQIESGLDFSDPAIWQQHIDSHKSRLLYKTYIDYGCYATQINRFLKYFPRSQILVILSEDLFRQPQKTIEEVWKHIGIEDDIENIHLSFKLKNVAKSPLEARIRRSLHDLQLIKSMLHILPESTKEMLVSYFRKFSKGKKPRISTEYRLLLENYYVREVKQLETLIERKLPEWLPKTDS